LVLALTETVGVDLGEYWTSDKGTNNSKWHKIA